MIHKISLIVAMTQNQVIGKENSMPWHLPADLAWFKQHTLNKPIVMGRKTFDSIGRPLPKRKNIVISRSKQLPEGIIHANNLNEALSMLKDAPEIMVIGGGQIFKQALPFADKLYLTEIQTQLEGDIFFPQIDLNLWQLSFSEYHQSDEKNNYDFIFKVYQKRI